MESLCLFSMEVLIKYCEFYRYSNEMDFNERERKRRIRLTMQTLQKIMIRNERVNKPNFMGKY